MPRKLHHKSVPSKDAAFESAAPVTPLRRSKRGAAPEAAFIQGVGDVEEEAKPAKRRRTVKGEEHITHDVAAEKRAKRTPAKAPRKAVNHSAGKSPAQASKNRPAVDASQDSDGGGSTENASPLYWLMKAEPNSRVEKGIDVKFSIDDLQAATEPEPWEGVRNHVAKKNMMAMKKGNLAFFYHSNCKVPGIAGVMEVVRESSVDASAFNPAHPYHDPKSSPETPRWYHVHVSFVRKFPSLVTLKTLQNYKATGAPELQDMQLLRQSRLSVSKVTPREWKFIMGLAEELKAEGDGIGEVGTT